MDRLTSHLFVFAQTAAQAAKKQAEDDPSLMPWWMITLVIVVLFAVPFMLGATIARALKMKDQATKISVILLALFIGLTPFVKQYIVGYLEHGKYEKDVRTWEQKQEVRNTIKQEHLNALTKAVPGLEGNIQFDPQTDRPDETKKPKASVSDPNKTGAKTPAGKTPVKKTNTPKTPAKTGGKTKKTT